MTVESARPSETPALSQEVREPTRHINGRAARIAVIGSGAFGSALAAVVYMGGCDVTVVSYERERRAEYEKDPQLRCCGFEYQFDTSINLAEFDLVILAVASQALRDVCRWIVQQQQKHYANLEQMPPLKLVCAAKGIERNTLKLPCDVLSECLPATTRQGVLSGPTFAKELRRGLPASVVIASDDEGLRELTKNLLHRPFLRVYDGTDVVGIEVSGALKNVIAVVAGGCDGLGLGNNARAAVVTRGFGEIVQIGMKLGANPMTFLGLGGLGDLFLTTSGDLSRNRQLGIRLAKGETKEQIMASTGEVIEGIATAESAHHLSQKFNLDTPIIHVAYSVLYEGLSVRDAVMTLLSRSHKGEFDWNQK
jgi:glycerol-3-phosphate dehydrogenase (NAD(P)+)